MIKIKVLHINRAYKLGSTGKILFDIHSQLINDGIDSVVCYGREGTEKGSGIYKFTPMWYVNFNSLMTRFTGIMYGGCYFSTKKLISIIKKEKPDVVQIHCINGYFVNVYKLIEFLKKNRIKTVLTLHAEFMHTANCAHAYDCEKWKNGCGKCPRRRQETKSLIFDRTHTSWERMKRSFDGFENDLTVVSVSPWLMDRARQSPILENKKHTVIYNGLDTNVFQPYNTDDLKEKHGITNEKIIFHATPDFSQSSNSLKGGRFVVEMAQRMKDENVKFIVAGNYNKSLKYPENMILLGQLGDQELLAKYYSMADATLLTSKRETFSMVCAESFCCGTPVVGFKAGAPEQISLKEYSEFVDYGDMDALQNALLKMLKRSVNKEEISSLAKTSYSKEQMAEKYMNLYRSVAENE